MSIKSEKLIEKKAAAKTKPSLKISRKKTSSVSPTVQTVVAETSKPKRTIRRKTIDKSDIDNKVSESATAKKETTDISKVTKTEKEKTQKKAVAKQNKKSTSKETKKDLKKKTKKL